MCWTLLPQSLCMHCGTHVNFANLQDPCDLVISESLPFGACGDESYRVVLGPEDAACDICLIPEDYFDNIFNDQDNTEYSPAVQTESYPGPTSFGGARGSRVATPFARGSSFRGQRQRYNGSRHNPKLSATMASPFQPQNVTPANPGQVNLPRGRPQTRIPPQGQRRSQTPYPPTFISDSDPSHSSSPRSNTGGARLSSSSNYTSSDEHSSSLNSSTPPTHPRLTLPGANSPFGFGYTPALRVPNPSPATTSFLSAYLNPPTQHHLPPLPSAEATDEAWVPAEWSPAVAMPSGLAHELDYTTADCVFRRHRVYFIAGLDGTLRDGTVIVVKPDGHEAHVVEYELYERTSAAVNRREDERARWACEKARQERITEESGRRRRGVCIYHPCRVAGCRRWHEEGQHRPLTPGSMGAFLRANRRVEEEHRGKERGTGVRFDGDDVFGGGEEKDGEQLRGAGPSRIVRTPSPRTQPPNTQDDETPSTIHLSAGHNHNPTRAPVRLVERDGEVRRRPMRDPAAILTGSPPPAPRPRRFAAARPSSSPSGQTTEQGSKPYEAEPEDDRNAMKLLDDGLDLADLRIGEDGEAELRLENDEEETY
ncbi:hypothetical protein CkaCkLH20_06596 [Colletotrichum karsti]|uniref:Uncharacterized protein n=1 Tax=Colletotrichum karsti TaxID=1095194 RepID=A0A9P6LKK7_9PEZI|nr:uncharacterized protein CkaCkLH20_06596 [Colletotrichum karsti]KAF9876150.1 hypothetical protein CkaCkLH20_06596 [Colletotrichum karsti]